MTFITTLEAFFLLGITSHLSKLLVVFTELIQLPKPMASKYTVIGIISGKYYRDFRECTFSAEILGVTIITVFGSHLAYRTMDIKLQSWWMIKETLAFNIFVTVTAIISILFIFIYVTVMKKLRELMNIHEKHAKPIKKRWVLFQKLTILLKHKSNLIPFLISFQGSADKTIRIFIRHGDSAID